MLVARAPTAAGAEALALELALPRLSLSPELVGARDGRRAEWADALVRGPSAPLTRAGDCAARLRGWADAWRAVAAWPEPPAAARSATAGLSRSPGRASLPPMERDVTLLALATDPAGLEGALQREARVARAQLFSKIGALPSGAREVAAESWRRAWARRAAELDTLADALAARKSRIERELIARAAPAHALDAEPRIPDPGAILLLAASGSEPTTARPYVPTWILFAAAGAALGLLITAPVTRVAVRGRRVRHDDQMRRLAAASHAFAAIPPPASATVDARLQIVSGSHSRRVAHATRELAAHFVADGERVLVMDGGRHFRLHDSFGAEPRLGFQECMRVELPVLGVVQNGGLPGLHVLAHGAPSRLRTWIPLGRLLDQARPYFSRVVIALDAHVSRQAGEALAGRLVDGWWAGRDVRKSRAARRFSTRLGIPLQAIEPLLPENASVDALVELITRRARSQAAPVPAAEETPPREPEWVETGEPMASVGWEAVPAPAEPLALEEAPSEAPKLEEAQAEAPALEEAPASMDAPSAPVALPAPLPEPAALEAMVEEFIRDAALDSGLELGALDAMLEELGRAAAVVAPERETALAPAPDSALETPPAPVAAPAPESALETPPASVAAPAPDSALERESEADAALALSAAPALETAAGSSAGAGARTHEPVVLESDPEVHERLRFLVWMRRLRDKSRGEVTHAG